MYISRVLWRRMGFRGRSRKLLWKGALSLWCSETPTVEYEEDILKWSMCCTGYAIHNFVEIFNSKKKMQTKKAERYEVCGRLSSNVGLTARKERHRGS